MSELSTQQQLKIQKAIRQAEDHLVTWIQDALDNRRSYGKLEESQFRNLVRVADTTESTEVIKNFLHYQVGRDEKWGRGQNSLAETIVSDINTRIKQKAKDIAKDAKSDDVNSIFLELTRRYLGYGARYLTYKLKGENQA
ncbi:hypothetical protein H6G54_13810 [Anabaena cylindrica FACHB-243]|uniref:CRISPR type III A-associated protein Csm2 n=1 Tax=Anabaena cylindrica (strain ATCC 27899 / PCC 7122) TaxID=272123 RepID=K9ZK15_ANACC|nr:MULTISPECIES: hypothetical protein [Anabaena]AFZ59583.1 hypothetical protein Anacy_4218 [Anabaena cylindrica PCC 7122]MBD2418752.1 hypothetical protein [Anabaena cylindrica FACHB-243]MBY5281621.1 hypothetical protein [Anabaena sp. CCAP 1446/1C]MBY5309147.1 hypothetical protein [Anabaena sp. CCAP 1446/1C]MCM2406316.1 hypothetical protein [Anabaena sp. CCAP 1446/1C]